MLRAQCEHIGIVGRALDAAIPAAVVGVAVSIVLAVRFVVLFVVAHEVFEREPVVRGDEVDARVGTAAIARVQIARAGDPVRELADQPALAFPDRAHDVAVLAVPLGPAHGEVADLIAALAQVPGLCDQLHLRQHRVLVNDVEECPEPIHLVQLARQRRREVEAKTVDVHVEHPVTQAVHDELQHARMHHIERVAGAREIHVLARVVRHEAALSMPRNDSVGPRRPPSAVWL